MEAHDAGCVLREPPAVDITRPRPPRSRDGTYARRRTEGEAPLLTRSLVSQITPSCPTRSPHLGIIFSLLLGCNGLVGHASSVAVLEVDHCLRIWVNFGSGIRTPPLGPLVVLGSLQPSETACRESSPGNTRRTADWMSPSQHAASKHAAILISRCECLRFSYSCDLAISSGPRKSPRCHDLQRCHRQLRYGLWARWRVLMECVPLRRQIRFACPGAGQQPRIWAFANGSSSMLPSDALIELSCASLRLRLVGDALKGIFDA